jgi:hypothetical protein
LPNFLGINNLKSIGGNLAIYENKSLKNLRGLENLTTIGGCLSIKKNTSLSSLDGLHNLTSIKECLDISENRSLANLTSLQNLNSTGTYLKVQHNESLTSLDGLENVTAIGGYMDVYDNPSLINLNEMDRLNPREKNIKRYRDENEIPQWRWGIGLGVNKSSLLNSISIVNNNNSVSNPKQNLSLQGNITTSYRLHRNLRFIGNLGLTKTKSLSYKKQYGSFFKDSETFDTVRQNYLFIDVPLIFRISLSDTKIRKIKPYVDIGFNIKFPLVNKSEYSRQEIVDGLYGYHRDSYYSGDLMIQSLSLYFGFGLLVGDNMSYSFSLIGLRSKPDNKRDVTYRSIIKSFTVSYYY